ncbi:MAG TPA: hypothetical protein VMD75_18910 [Candidatus Binataceae bacterium]|nr:hypothetical protein [Candidatus Binataceae bacterium]
MAATPHDRTRQFAHIVEIEVRPDLRISDWANRIQNLIELIFADQELKALIERAVVAFAGLAEKFSAVLKSALPQIVECFDRLDRAEPVPGYEPLFIDLGYHPLVARLIGRMIVQGAADDVASLNALSPVAEAIRFMAKPQRRAKAIVKKAEFLVRAGSTLNRLDAFAKTDCNSTNFSLLLQGVLRGEPDAIESARSQARCVAPHLSLRRGPKIQTASYAHQVILQLLRGAGYTWDAVQGDFTDRLTTVTRSAFNEPNFDPRPALRRLRKQSGDNRATARRFGFERN